MDRTRAVIGADAKFAGTISNVKSIEIDGAVEADLTAEKLSIGATGKFTGQVSCDLVVIGGAYDGIMQAGSIWATETAQICWRNPLSEFADGSWCSTQLPCRA